MKKRFWMGGLLAAILAVLLAAGASAENTTLYVSSTGSISADGLSEGTPTTLEQAVDIADSGDTICVLDDLTVNSTIIIEKDLTFQGIEGKTKPIIRTASTLRSSIFEITADNITVTFNGIAFDGSDVDNSSNNNIYGGAIKAMGTNVNNEGQYLQYITVNIYNCDFTEFEAYAGGAVCLDNLRNPTLFVDQSSFENNKAGSNAGGGGIAVTDCYSSTMTIRNSYFEKNTAYGHGGAISSYGISSNNVESITIEDCEFVENELTAESSTYGGGAFGVSYTSSENRTVSLIGNYFYMNKSNSNGGAVFVNATNTFNVTNNTFDRNEAAIHGGAIDTKCGDECRVTFTGNTFSNNTAEGQGGAVNLGSAYFETSITGPVLFARNSTDYKMGNAICFFATSKDTTSSYLYATNGAVFQDNGIPDDGIDRDTILIYSSGQRDDIVSIADYMPDGTRLRWKLIQETSPGSQEYELISASREDTYVAGDRWSSGSELYLDSDTSAPTLLENQYSNKFIDNHAQYGGAISNYGSLTIGEPGEDITVNKIWANEEQQEHNPVTVNLVRESDQKEIDNLSLGAENSWTGTFFDFPKNVAYTITENNVAEYASSVSYNGNTVTVTNTKQATTYTVTYQYTGTVPPGAPSCPATTTAWPDAEMTVETAPVLAGYTFSGWTIQSPDGVTITDGQFTMPSSDVVLVGSWTQNAPATYTLTYNANCGDSPASINAGAYEAGTAVILGSSDTFIRNGYTLTGWNTAADGSGTSYNLGDAFAMPTEDITLYAQWERQYVAIRPADVTIYMGGENGYEGVVSSDDQIVAADSLPVPGFIVTLPEDLTSVDVTDLILQYQEGDALLQWEFEKYGGGDHNIYRIDPKEDTAARPIRMEFTNAAGETVTDDQFVITDHLEQTLTMEVYGEGIQAGDVVVVYQGVSYPVTTGNQTAELTVRGTTDKAEYGGIYTDVTQIPIGESGAVAPAGTTYTINDSPVQVEDPSGIALLFDDIIENNDIAGTSNTDLLTQRADEVLAEMEKTGLSGRGDRQYEAKYLDLVDTNNGNAWVTASQEITICWPLPEGTDRHTDFVLLHFEDLHREMGTSAISDAIDHCTVTQVDIQVTKDYITFTVDSGGFSPFLLVWEEESDDKPDRPHRPGNTDSESSKPDEAPELNMEDHYAYIVGYEDGTVRPEGYLTRAEVATIFFRLLTDTSREQFWTTQNDYADVTQEAWYNNAIATMTNAGILKGYEDGTFRPDASITRAEFAAIAARFDRGAAETGSGFSDTAGHWAEAEICRAVSLGWIQGYEDGTFRPDQPITRAEVMTIVNRMLDRAPEDETDLLPDMNLWSDNLPGAWYYLAVQEATNSHTYIRKDNGYETWVAMLEDPDWTQYQ